MAYYIYTVFCLHVRGIAMTTTLSSSEAGPYDYDKALLQAYMLRTLITRSNKRPPHTWLHGNSAHALNCTTRRWFSVTWNVKR